MKHHIKAILATLAFALLPSILLQSSLLLLYIVRQKFVSISNQGNQDEASYEGNTRNSRFRSSLSFIALPYSGNDLLLYT